MNDDDTPSKPTQRVIHADCLDALRAMDADSVDAIVTDPPAGIAFMNKDWDRDKGGRTEWVAWMTEIARECLRVIKPGGHALVWAIPRTSHWTGWAWEDAGWQPRDKVVHLFGSGFPKSLDVSKAIDKAAGAERADRGGDEDHEGTVDFAMKNRCRKCEKPFFSANPCACPREDKVAITDAAREWQGWGTALKPAAEDWWLFRKPLVGTVAANVLAHGTGAINVDGCRIEGKLGGNPDRFARTDGGSFNQFSTHPPVVRDSGRWPANVTLDEEAAALLDEQTGTLRARGNTSPTKQGTTTWFGNDRGQDDGRVDPGDNGGASRFFYTAKASRRERGAGNTHPTVKPVALMRWLCRLVCPPDGTILDPFCGSGTTLLAARAEGFSAIGIEREAEYVGIIQRRLEEATPEWLREIELEGETDGDTPKTEPAPTSLDDLLGFNDE